MMKKNKSLYFILILVVASLCVSIAVQIKRKHTYNSETLILVHVVHDDFYSRHGDRTPGQGDLWESNPYYNESYYEPYGYSQLTNDGKRKMYDLGIALRNRYGTFLGDTWNTKIYDAWSSNYNRTKMSTALVLAGLFPPKGSLVWQEDLLWQPIPFNYLPVTQDKELSSWACSTVAPLIYNDESNTERLKTYDKLIETLSKETGFNVDYITALDLYFGMYMQTELGFPLENWTQAVFPEPLKSYVVDFYYIETSTKKLKTVIAGYLLKKILIDTQNKVNGILNPQERQIFLYSAHEVNIATVLTSLNAFNLVNVPPYGSYLLFEVHKIDGIYGIKMFYDDYEAEEPHTLILPGCAEFCPLNEFVKLTADIIPKSDIECYGEQ